MYTYTLHTWGNTIDATNPLLQSAHSDNFHLVLKCYISLAIVSVIYIMVHMIRMPSHALMYGAAKLLSVSVLESNW